MTLLIKLPLLFGIVPTLAQEVNEYSTTAKAPGPIFWIVYTVVVLFMLVAMWKVFTKAGQPGWAILIPIYNLYVMCKIAGRPGWWLILYFIPVVNLIIIIIICLDIAKNFGKGAGFGIGLLLLPIIFYPILGFGSATYQGGTPPAPAQG
jgi:Family of unknown function (DUF5684)